MTDAMTLREMCNVFGATLRFHGHQDLLFPIRDGRRRLFARRAPARLKLTPRGKRSGLPLADIRQLPEISGQDRLSQARRNCTCDISRDRRAVMKRQWAEPEDVITVLQDQGARADVVLGTVRKAAAA
ncbi:MAG: hypothetical protein RLZZ413_48 [Pseudomonadota bacterium]